MRKLTYLFLIAFFAFATTEDLYARRSGGSRSSSSRSSWGSSSRSSSRSSWGSSSKSSSSSKKSSWGSSSKGKSTSSKSTVSRPKTTTSKTSIPAPKKKLVPRKPISATDKKRIAAAKTSGTYYKNRDKATADFKAKHAKTYTSKYATKPATRPAHIPQTYSSGGRSYNITYNAGYGGYGYMGPSGSWIMYDMMTDAIMMNAMMNQRGYIVERDYYNNVPVSRPVVVRESRPMSVWGFLLGLVIIVVIVGAIVIVSKK